MVVHVVAEHPKNGGPQAAPLMGICGKEVGSGFYVLIGDHSSQSTCPGCRASLAKHGEGNPSSEAEVKLDESSE
jgi:hypothetical protein